MAVKALIKKRPLAARTASAVPTQSAVVPSERSLDVQTAEDAQPFIEIKATADDDTVSTRSDTSEQSEISPVDVDKFKNTDHDDGVSLVSEASEGFLSALCCHSGSVDYGENELHGIKKEKQARLEENDEEGLMSKVAVAFLYMIGQAPPVQFVKCFEDRSVDESEVSLPQVLTDMAEEFDDAQRRLEARDRDLKQQYERQQQQKKKRSLLRPLRIAKSGATNRSSGATVSSSSSVFDKINKRASIAKKDPAFYEI